MSEIEPDDLAIGTIISKRFKVVKKLGEGGCGSVYKVSDLEDINVFHAMKVEMNCSQAGSVLKMEVQILAALENKPHVTKLIMSGKKETFTYMVMTLLGDSLNNLIRNTKGCLSVSTQVRIGINVLFGLKQIHDIGYIHRDLKPANVAQGMKGTPEERFFLILDFGLARQFVVTEPNGAVVMRRPRERALFRGTTKYCSLAMHERADQGRVDDIWALMYMLAEFRRPLPWADSTDKNEVGDLKRQTPDDVLLAKSPKELLEITSYIRTLNYYDHPDYSRIYTLLRKIMAEGNIRWTDPYHWEAPPKRSGSVIVKLSKGSKKRTSLEPPVKPGGASTPSKTRSCSPAKNPLENDEEYFKPSDFLGNPLGL